MTRIERAAFRRHLGDLSPSRLAAFVAAIWDARGWTVEADDGLVWATDRASESRSRTLLVPAARADDPPETVDAVVTARRDDPGAERTAAALDADLLDADDLYDLVLYGVSPETGDAILERFFGRPARTGESASGATDPDEARAVGSGGDASARDRRWTLALVVVVAAGLLLAGALAAGEMSGGTTAPAVESPTSNPEPTAGPTPEESASARTVTTTALAHRPTTSQTRRTTTIPDTATAAAADQPRYLGLEPTCDRPPGLVIKVQLGALRNDNGTDTGIATAWRFASPDNRRAVGGYPVFVRIVRSDTYSPMLRFERAVYGPVRRENGTARQRVTLIGPGGERAAYEFVLERQTGGEHDGCWMTDGVYRLNTEATPA